MFLQGNSIEVIRPRSAPWGASDLNIPINSLEGPVVTILDHGALRGLYASDLIGTYKTFDGYYGSQN